MDLREKRSVKKKIGEAILRFRLIFVLLMAIGCGVLFSGYADWVRVLNEVAQNGREHFLDGSAWLFLLLIGALSIPRFILGGLRFGLSFLGLFSASVLLSFLFQTFDSISAYVIIFFSILSLLLFILVRHSLACAIFPAVLSMGALVGAFRGASIFHDSVNEMAVFALLLFSDMISVSLIAGRELRAGASRNGAFLEGVSIGLPITCVNAFLIALFFSWRNHFDSLGEDIAFFFSYLAVFYLLSLPLLSFAPFGRLRAEKRSLKISGLNKEEKEKG